MLEFWVEFTLALGVMALLVSVWGLCRLAAFADAMQRQAMCCNTDEAPEEPQEVAR